ncbi:hypothetical protein ACMYR3_08250 [Ampullimonas aquatilis]|uniref:hypothetical protein n=1 Tax=Ampullimonas aquatilis TaxID=1341549 RepID=UPI003C76F3A3
MFVPNLLSNRVMPLCHRADCSTGQHIRLARIRRDAGKALEASHRPTSASKART